jgi:hypothetical protein
MAAPLGNVLHWVFSGLALVIIGLTSYFVADDWLSGRVFDETEMLVIGSAIALAVVTWLIGRAFRYAISRRARHPLWR